jgi:hypothetical protein
VRRVKRLRRQESTRRGIALLAESDCSICPIKLVAPPLAFARSKILIE